MCSILKCLAILLCDLSLLTIHISDWCHFSDIHISQGRCGGIFKYELLQIYYRVHQWKVWKQVENRLIFGEVIGKSLVSCFFLTHGIEDQKFVPIPNFYASAHSIDGAVGIMFSGCPSVHMCIHACIFGWRPAPASTQEGAKKTFRRHMASVEPEMPKVWSSRRCSVSPSPAD